MAQPGGVLTRAGHTEAGCDLARLAGLEPAAVIVEILNEDGTMARRPELEAFAREHGLKIGTIADLIRYRLEKERSVERIAERDVQTDFGPFRLYCYEDHVNGTVHLALVRGELDAGERAAGARAPEGHACATWSARARRAPQLDAAQRAWSASRARAQGVVVLLRPHESPLDDRRGGALGRRGRRRPARPRGAQVLRTYGIGAQILRDLGVRRMRVLSAPKQMHGLSAFGLEVAEYVDEAT